MNLPTIEDCRKAFRPHKLKFISWTSFRLGWLCCRAWVKSNQYPQGEIKQIKRKMKTPLK